MGFEMVMKRVKPTVEDGRRALCEHAAGRARLARARYGPEIDMPAMLRLLGDAEVVRHPVEICFEAAPLEPGEFAYASPCGERPHEGFRLFVHPHFEDRPEALPLLIAYHLVRINYGVVATHEHAEIFGATLLGMTRDEYYETLCALADEIAVEQPAPARGR